MKISWFFSICVGAVVGKNLLLIMLSAFFSESVQASGWFWGGHPPVRNPSQSRSQAFVPDNGPEERPKPPRRPARAAVMAPERAETEATPDDLGERPRPQRQVQPSNDNVQQAQCYPATEEAKNWPVKAIYLHGLFEPSGAGTGYQNLEKKNMQQMKELAEKLKIRIALPRAQRITNYTYKVKTRGGTTQRTIRVRTWTGASLQEIENASRAACGGSQLADGRALIGFSNGGYRARRIAADVCQPNSGYSRIFAIGAPDSAGSVRCSFLTDLNPHELPSNDYFARNMQVPVSVRRPANVPVRRSSN